MKIRPPWIAIFILLALAGTACQAVLSLENRGSEAILFQDDFSDPSSGWLQGKDHLGSAGYSEGGFSIRVNSLRSGKLTILRLRSFEDVRIQVDATKADGPDDNSFGIVCRYRDENNFYFFEISSDGYYGIGKYKDNKLDLINADQMQPSDAILQGDTTNHLRADCVGDELTLYVNGNKIAEARNADFRSGSVGLIAGTFDTPGIEIVFDNFTLFRP